MTKMKLFLGGLAAARASFRERIDQPQSQRKMVLTVVSIALLLDNMLYMVIVPIIPDYLGALQLVAEGVNVSRLVEQQLAATANGEAKQLRLPVPHVDDAKVGTLFAFKAIVQLLFNPISGTIIDRIGYDMPMMCGLMVIFVSTSIFAFGQSYGVMFIARGLQGVGSAFADTAGLAMIADRYVEDKERTKALGIALAFISFGCLVAPPFGGILYQFCGKEFPFITLAFVALLDGFLLMAIMKPVRIERTVLKAEGNLPHGTPIHHLLMDTEVVICAGALAVSNVSLAFLEPTIANWMADVMQATNWQMGLVWLPAFVPHVAGVYTTVILAARYPQHQWLMATLGLAIDGVGCLFVPICTNFVALMLPISVLCYGIALVDTAILPTMAYLVDTRHVSVYGSVYAIADFSYSLAYAFGPIVAGSLVKAINFTGLNIAICLSILAYLPVMFRLRKVYSADVPHRQPHNPDSNSSLTLINANANANANAKANVDGDGDGDARLSLSHIGYPGYDQAGAEASLPSHHQPHYPQTSDPIATRLGDYSY